MRPQTTLLAVLAAAVPAAGWVSSAQSLYGAQISEIQNQMNGLVSGRTPIAEYANNSAPEPAYGATPRPGAAHECTRSACSLAGWAGSGTTLR